MERGTTALRPPSPRFAAELLRESSGAGASSPALAPAGSREKTNPITSAI